MTYLTDRQAGILMRKYLRRAISQENLQRGVTAGFLTREEACSLWRSYWGDGGSTWLEVRTLDMTELVER